MIPSLVARELRASIVEYLVTTFALSEDEAYKALTEFLLDERQGIFRGPYLRVRLPFVEAPEDADLGVTWTPPGFRPYAHQLAAWKRLSGRGQQPKPTLVTTGTGSGKSEAFLIPVIDHAIWARGRGQRGIKALLLYPMNALVTDQQHRIAALLADPAVSAAGVTGGVWIGDDGSVSPHREMSDKHLITDTNELLANPPDILLTNYKMLDRLLTNAKYTRLWAANTRPQNAEGNWEQPLTYLVLDELHSYDGAQGTDVAMLLRRIGHRIGTATSSSPLNGVACIGTSATLGSSDSAAADMCLFASKIFGMRFDATAIVGEQRRTVGDVCGDIDFALPVPIPRDLIDLNPSDRDGLARAFTGVGFDDAQAVGDRLLRHRVTASVLRVAAEHPRRWPDAVAGVAQQIQEWGMALAESPNDVAEALERFVALVSQARGTARDGSARALFSVEVQVWIREVSRLKRKVSLEPGFSWADSPALTVEENPALELPSIYCLNCGRSGWMGVVNKAGGQGAAAIERVVYDPDTNPYLIAVRERGRTRSMLRANPGESDLLWLDPDSGQVHGADTDEPSRIPVLVAGMVGGEKSGEARDEAALHQQCPSCGTSDSIRFLGSRVTTLASVGITQMFGSDYVADDERKLLAFTDSVQDASHRASFFSGRTHRFNLRATLSGALQQRKSVPLLEVAGEVLAKADRGENPADDLFSLIPPDLLLEDWLAAAWKTPGSAAALRAREGLALRLGFDAVLEAGLRARLGRTLETTGTAVAEVIVSDEEWLKIVSFATEAIQANTGLLLIDDGQIQTWAEGILERLRLRGGIFHPFLDRYVAENGNRYRIWGGADQLAPKFPKGISAPAFFTSSKSDEFDSIAGPQTWLRLWTSKVLGVEGAAADQALRDLLNVFSDLGVLETRNSSKGPVWGLPQARILFVDVAPLNGVEPLTEVRCGLCSHRHYASADRFDQWVGRPCLRLRCAGSYAPSRILETNFYRTLYRSGRIRRVVATEHTGLLSSKQREKIEEGFKEGGSPDAPNVLTATPTLEMGIDIGDLSAVMLTAVPRTQSNYIQRVGRAGRKTGNSFVTTFVEADPRSLYFLQDPELMISGDIIAPSCYLDAIEILRRQYLAFLIDQAAMGESGTIPSAGMMPLTIGKLSTNGLQADGWLSVILEEGRRPEMVERFVNLFGHHLDVQVAARLSSWAAIDMRSHVDRVIDRWRSHVQTMTNQRDRLKQRDKEFDAMTNPSAEDVETQGRLAAELRSVGNRIAKVKNQDTLGALEALGLLPNYTLFDDTVTLEVNLWQPNTSHNPADESSRRFISTGAEYVRSASLAIRELAPGNYFYVDAHRVKIDAVDNGTEHEPAHSTWRFCPACAWSTSDASANEAACPRCGATGVADQGSLLPVLPMKVVSSTEREVAARTSDESDDRDIEFHDVLTTVDIDPSDIVSAYMHTSATFGVETTRAATIRFLNFGIQMSKAIKSRQVRVNGYDESAALFTVCRFCGSVFGVQGDDRKDEDPNHHRAWCKVRSGSRKPQWDQLALAHELVTEAVRILLPVAEFEAKERVLSFKALLLLGLRDSFGGDPTHFGVMETDFPAPGDDEARNRFVVIHDRVPGGTGYLTRLADPNQLKVILTRAEELITMCECQTRGEPGCHRCLYAAVGRNDIPFVSRGVALEILEEILPNWQMKPAEEGTITGVNLSRVHQSELERMFKVLLQRWATNHAARVTSRPDPDNASLTRFDLRFQDGPQWEIREQQNLVIHGTKPDFYATRVDLAGSPPVAIYLDGWEWHGKDLERVDRDAMRRAAVRGGGSSVWVLTFADVKGALTALNQESQMNAVTPLSSNVRHGAVQGAKHLRGDSHAAFSALELGAFDQLMTYLGSPDTAAWKQLAEVTALAAGRTGAVYSVEHLALAIQTVAAGSSPVPAAHETDEAMMVWKSQSGQEGATGIERGDSLTKAAVLAYDTSIETDRDRWSDWLHLGNLLQYLGSKAIISTTSLHDTEPVITPQSTEPEVISSNEELLQDVLDMAVRDLAVVAVRAGFINLEVGYEVGDEIDAPIEVAWPTAKVGILVAGSERSGSLEGWDLREPSAWTESELLQVLSRMEA